MLSGDNGVLQRATDAKEKTERATIIETAKTDILGQIAENKGNDISKKELADILNKQFKTVDENSIPDEISSTSDIKLTTTDEKYKINLSEIYIGTFAEEENEIVEGNPGEWETNEAGDTLTKYLGSSKNIVIPNRYNGKEITTIGEALFYNSDIVSLTISEKITTIMAGAFSGCSNLTGDIKLPSTLESIGEGSFGGCIGLTGDLTIPDNVTTLNNGAFAGCIGLTGKLKIGNKVESFGTSVFDGPFSNAEINMKNIPNDAFRGKIGGALVLGDSVETIGNTAFQNCNNLTGNLQLSENVKSIGSNAFAGCTNENFTITVPSTIQSVGNAAFGNVSHIYYTGELDKTNWAAKAYN